MKTRLLVAAVLAACLATPAAGLGRLGDAEKLLTELVFLAVRFFADDFLPLAFLEAFDADFLALVALALAFDFVDLAAFDVFDFAPAFALLALPPALFSAI